MRLLKYLIYFLLVSEFLFMLGCHNEPKVITKVVYRDRVIYKQSCPNLSFPEFPKLNIYKVEYNSSIYYCFDVTSIKLLTEYLLQIKDLEKTYKTLTGEKNETK